MSNSELTQVLFLLLLLVGLAQLFGWLFVKMRQPKVVGEILAGVVLGNALIGRLPWAARFLESARHQGNVLDFVYWLGLLLLMFLAGAETQQLFTRDERREVGWLTVVGTGFPFLLGLLFAPWLIRPSLAGPNGNHLSLTIVLAVGVAVTSVPVVSKSSPTSKSFTLVSRASFSASLSSKTSFFGWPWRLPRLQRGKRLSIRVRCRTIFCRP
jgi:Kef-type K+ transport system membrane component KefB